LRKNLLLTISLLSLTIILSPIFTVVTLGIPAGNHLKDHDVWDPDLSTLAWVHGNPKGYSEGQTAAFRVTIDDVTAGQTLWFIVELDLNASGAYAFTDIEPWDTTYQQDGVHLRPPPLESSLTGDREGFNAAGAVITEVDFLGYSEGYQSWNVTLTTTTPGPVYVVYGGHIAASGDSIASGGTVPPGQGASSINGVFQARVNSPGTGAKTINFNANAIGDRIPTQSFAVTKITIPPDITTNFNFSTSAPPGNFSLTANSNWNSGDLPAGNYTITELVPEGWDLTNVVVLDPDFGSVVDLETGTVTIDLDFDEHITIIFVNTVQASLPAGTISVHKVVVPSGADTAFDFVTSISDDENFALAGGESWSSGELVAGNYTITELVPEGWDLTNVVVLDPDFGSVVDLETGTVIVDLDPGEHITIIFVNTAQPPPQISSLIVEKVTIPSGASTIFDFVTSASDEGFSLTDNTRWYSEELSPGSYTVTELPPKGWDLTNIIVEGTSNYGVDLSAGTVTIDLSPNEHIAITFVNTVQQTLPFGSFTVTKLTLPSGAASSFSFVTSASNEVFALTDGNSWNSGSLSPGNYTLTELAQTGWDLTNIIVIDPDGGSWVDLATGTVFIDLDPGETITILYQNTQQQPQTGTINVVKTTCPTNTTINFNFVTSIPPGTFGLTDGTTWNSGPLAPGNYTLTELVQPGWDLTSIIINDPTNNSRIDLATRSAFIVLDPGETITILYQNTQQAPDQGSFSVTKVTCPVGSSEPFRFMTSVPGESFSLTDGQSWSSGMLPPGVYTVTELVPPGWEITNILLDDPSENYRVDLSTGTTTINLQAGAHVSILYQDAQTPPQGGFISVVKVTCPTDTGAEFSFVSSASAGAFSLGNGEVWTSSELAPGRYLITEIMQPGWVLSNIVIADPSGTSTADLSTGTATINLQAGTHVTILYQNTQQPHPECCNKDPCQCNPCNQCNQKPY